jgi:hypothetical protein
MNSPIPDNDVPQMSAIFCELKGLATHIVILERRIATNSAPSSHSYSQLPKTAKKIEFHHTNHYY